LKLETLSAIWSLEFEVSTLSWRLSTVQINGRCEDFRGKKQIHLELDDRGKSGDPQRETVLYTSKKC